jgi:hypothetical protein
MLGLVFDGILYRQSIAERYCLLSFSLAVRHSFRTTGLEQSPCVSLTPMPQTNIKYPDTAMRVVANAIAVTIATDFDAMGHRDSRLDHDKTRFAVEGVSEGLLTCYLF